MSVLERFGVNQSSLVKFKDPSESSGRLMLLDGDGSCYTATATAKRLDTALRRFEQSVLEYMFLAKCDTARVHITPKGCKKNGRYLLNTVKPYQGNRVGIKKPPLLEVLRSALPEYFKKHPEITIVSSYDYEADDGLMIDSYTYSNAVLVSEDKDLLISPVEQYDVKTGRFLKLPKGDIYGYIDLVQTGAGKPKVIGKGTKFWFTQLLMGDTADNIQGIKRLDGKLCGAVAAYNFMKDISSEAQAADSIIRAYKEVDQNIIPEAEALWLIRNTDDSAFKYLMSLGISDRSKNILEGWYYEGNWKKDQ